MGALATGSSPFGARRSCPLSLWERAGVRAAPVRQSPAPRVGTLLQFKPKWLFAPAQQAPSASFSIAKNCLFALSLPALLSACAALQDAPRLNYLCPNDLRFEARLYQDMALLEGLRGHAVLERVADHHDGEGDGALRYADPTVRAQFGLGVDARPAPPFDPNAPVQTNIRVGDGNNGPG